MTEDGRGAAAAADMQRKALGLALALNAAMFVVDLVGGLLGGSSSLIADSLDMLADSSAYGIALAAVGRSLGFKVRAARFSGVLLFVLGAGVVLDVVRRAVFGSQPVGLFMMAIAFLALIVNAVVLRLLARYREGEVHLRAAWIFTRADVLANLGVIAGGVLVMVTHSRWPDLVVGFAIGLFVIREAREILEEAQGAREENGRREGNGEGEGGSAGGTRR